MFIVIVYFRMWNGIGETAKVFLEQQRNVPPHPQHHLSGSKVKVKHKAVYIF